MAFISELLCFYSALTLHNNKLTGGGEGNQCTYQSFKSICRTFLAWPFANAQANTEARILLCDIGDIPTVKRRKTRKQLNRGNLKSSQKQLGFGDVPG
uniref:Uncharacterized protein n=1 Tax=Salvator merianae TaxID=96440 RepID=A0A8D0KNY5_SALMN